VSAEDERRACAERLAQTIKNYAGVTMRVEVTLPGSIPRSQGKAVRVIDEPGLLFAAVAVPAYWVMMALAAAKAFFQLIFNPSYWEKTTHGLNTPSRPVTPTASGKN